MGVVTWVWLHVGNFQVGRLNTCTGFIWDGHASACMGVLQCTVISLKWCHCFCVTIASHMEFFLAQNVTPWLLLFYEPISPSSMWLDSHFSSTGVPNHTRLMMYDGKDLLSYSIHEVFFILYKSTR